MEWQFGSMKEGELKRTRVFQLEGVAGLMAAVKAVQAKMNGDVLVRISLLLF